MGKNFLGKLFGLTALFIMVFRNVFANNLPKSTDIVVIGGGGAGLTAAISAHEKGAKVILVEKNHVLGGNAVTDITVFGKIAEENAATYSRSVK